MPETTRKRGSASKPSLSTGNLPDATIVAPKPVKTRKGGTDADCPYKVDPSATKKHYVAPKFPNPNGRPVEFTEAIADEVCLRLTEGEPLVRICKSSHLPDVSTIYRWLIRFPLFCEMYTRAREEQADTNADEIIAIADEDPKFVEYKDKDGNVVDIKIDTAFVAYQKLRIESRKWTAAKLKPRKYGERIAMEGVDGGAPIGTVDLSTSYLAEVIKNLEMKKRAD